MDRAAVVAVERRVYSREYQEPQHLIEARLRYEDDHYGSLNLGLFAGDELVGYVLAHLDDGAEILIYPPETPDFEAAAIAAAQRLDGGALDAEILGTQRIGNLASRVAVIAEVRAALFQFQRNFAMRPGGAVLDGRDIGTVIAPHATAKLFVTASPEVRARRRVAELLARGMPSHYEDVLIDIHARDERDIGREAAPLARAEDAELLDTSEMTIDEAIAAAIGLVGARIKASA